MADRPILFSAPMIRALLEGRKTQTRRVLKPQPRKWEAMVIDITEPFQADRAWEDDCGTQIIKGEWGQIETVWSGPLVPGMCEPDHDEWRPLRLPYAIGDRLWAREAWNQFWFSQDGEVAWPVKKLVGPDESKEIDDEGSRVSPPQVVHRESERACEHFPDQKWRHSIHMPRWASRLTLAVTGVKVERLQDISEADAQAEGVFVPEAQYAQQGSAAPRLAFSGLWESIHGPGAWGANPWVVALTFTVHRCNIDQMEVNRG